jgi:hypothetical protein
MSWNLRAWQAVIVSGALAGCAATHSPAGSTAHGRPTRVCRVHSAREFPAVPTTPALA